MEGRSQDTERKARKTREGGGGKEYKAKPRETESAEEYPSG